MDSSLPGSSAHGDSSGKNTAVVATPSSRGSPPPRDWTQVSALQADCLSSKSSEKTKKKLEGIAYPFSRGSPQLGIELGSPTFQVDSLPAKLIMKPSSNLENIYLRLLNIGIMNFLTVEFVLIWFLGIFEGKHSTALFSRIMAIENNY